MTFNDLMSKTSKQRKTAKVKLHRYNKNDQKCCYVAKHSKQRKTTKAIKIQ